MKKIYITLIILLFLSPSLLNAQENKQKKEMIKTQKVAFITNKLNLSADAAQKFWPLYNEYDAKKEEISKKKRNLMDKMSNEFSSLSEEEFRILGDEFIDLNLKDAELAKEYHHKFKVALEPSQILLLYKAENQFKQYLIKQIRNKQATEPRRRN